MSEQNANTGIKPQGEQAGTASSSADKGKGKAVDAGQDVSMGEDDDSSEEESGGEEEQTVEAEEEEDEDDMAEIDMDNIVSEGRRTRGKAIDFAKAAQETPEEDEEEDEEDDDDFEDPDDAMKQ